MGITAKSSPLARGRPRDGALDERILEQVLALLGSRGYGGLTLDELAARSGVAKSTILRRWPSKAAGAAAGGERLALPSVHRPGLRPPPPRPPSPPPRAPGTVPP